MASIDRRNGEYRVRWREGGRARSRQCPTLAAAKALQREVEEAISLGRGWEPPKPRQRVDFNAIHRAFLTEHKTLLAPATLRHYAVLLDVWEGWLRQQHPDTTPSQLNKRLLLEYHGWLQSAGRSRQTAKAYVSRVLCVWRWASEDDVWAPDVAPYRRLVLPDAPATPTRAPTWLEMDKVISVLQGPHRHLALVLRFTGLRVKQALSLRWTDLDVDHQLLTVRGELGKSRQERAGRLIPLSPHLIAEVLTWPHDADEIISLTSEPVIDTHVMARAWSLAEVRREVWHRRPHHAFRKGFTSGLKRLRADDEAVEYLLGHAMGLRGYYVDPSALPLEATVALIPPLNVFDDCVVSR